MGRHCKPTPVIPAIERTQMIVFNEAQGAERVDVMEEDLEMCGHFKPLLNCAACSGEYEEYEMLTPKEIEEAETYEESRGGIDKCMNCGGYKWNDTLTYPGQVCKKGCVNPNEY